MKQKDLNKALCMATWYGHDFCLEMLIEAGAEVNLVYQSYTPLETAARRGSVKCIKLLIQAGADVNMRGNLTGPNVNIEKLSIADYLRYLRYTPLMSAACSYNQEAAIECVRMLLRENVRINIVNSIGGNALASYLGYMLPRNNKTMVLLLHAAGEKVPAGPSVPDYLLFKDLKLSLKHLCREAIRKHLLDVDPHEHLFGRVPKLGPPTSLTDYLVYEMSIEK